MAAQTTSASCLCAVQRRVGGEGEGERGRGRKGGRRRETIPGKEEEEEERACKIQREFCCEDLKREKESERGKRDDCP
jgi:hypothetical protein